MPPLTAGYLQTRKDDWDGLNYVLRNLQDRLDALGGDRGSWQFKNALKLVGVDSANDLIVNVATQGLVLVDTQSHPHWWRVTISNVGALVISDLGTTKP